MTNLRCPVCSEKPYETRYSGRPAIECIDTAWSHCVTITGETKEEAEANWRKAFGEENDWREEVND